MANGNFSVRTWQDDYYDGCLVESRNIGDYGWSNSHEEYLIEMNDCEDDTYLLLKYKAQSLFYRKPFNPQAAR